MYRHMYTYNFGLNTKVNVKQYWKGLDLQWSAKSVNELMTWNYVQKKTFTRKRNAAILTLLFTEQEPWLLLGQIICINSVRITWLIKSNDGRTLVCKSSL